MSSTSTEKTATATAIGQGEPEEPCERLWVAGANGVCYPADFYPGSRKLRVRYQDQPEPREEVKKSLAELPVGERGLALLAETQVDWLPLIKGFNPNEPRDEHGKWSATGHPNALALDDSQLPEDPKELRKHLAVTYGFSKVDASDEWLSSKKGRQAVAEAAQTFDLLAGVMGVPKNRVTLGLNVKLSFNGKPTDNWAGRFVDSPGPGAPAIFAINSALLTPGVGRGARTIVHEWGHLFDCAAGVHTAKSSYLTKVWKQEKEPKEPAAAAMWRITKLFSEKGHGSPISFYEHSKKLDGKNVYHQRNSEMFARSFEAYIGRKLDSGNPFQNKLLGSVVASKDRPLGPLSKKMEPHFDTLLSEVKKQLPQPLKKGADIVKLPPGTHLTSQEMKEMHLTWITAHPNGPGTEPAVPLIVHDNGDHYVVVGGAGGKMNQQVLKKDAGNKQQAAQHKKDAKALQKQAADEAKAKDPEGFKKLEDAAKLYQAKSKEALAEHVSKALDMLGGSMPDLIKEARAQAVDEALKHDPNATPEEIHKFADEAEKAVQGQAKKAVESAMQKALDSVAKAEINQEAVTAQDIEATVGGKKLVKTMTPEEMQELLTSAVSLDKVRVAEASVKKALKTGKTDVLPGIEAFLAAGAPTEAEVQDWTTKGYLKRQSVLNQTALVKESMAASESVQKLNQALGGSDSLNGYAATLTGSSMFTPETVQYLGVENAARVLAASLGAQGKDTAKLGEKLGERIADKVDIHTAAVLQQAAQMDALAQTAVDAATSGEGLVTMAQALIVKQNQAERKFQLINMARGHIQAASSLYHHLSHPSKSDMVLPGGTTEVATRAKAYGLGLADGDFELDKVGDGGFQLKVKADAIAKLAKPTNSLAAERAAKLSEIKRDAALAGTGSWKPSEGWQDGTETGPDGKLRRADLAPHQIAAARAIVEHNKLLLNYGAGTGKTAVYYAAGAELLASGKAKLGLITMPAKPRAQQEDYHEVQADGSKLAKEGEKTKFLKKEMADRFTVVSDTKDLKKKLDDVKAGKLAVLIMSPEMMRKHADLLSDSGFGGKDSFVFADEAHELAIGEGDKHGEQWGSGKAQAAAKMAQGAGYVAMGSGTLIENDASELYGALNTIAPDVFKTEGRKAFGEKWQRIAGQGAKDATLGGEMLAGLNSEVGGYMLHHHQDPTTPDGKPVSLEKRSEPIELTESQKDLVRKANEQRELDEKSQDPNVRAAAALKWSGSVIRAAVGPPMFDKISDYVGERRAKDPSYKAVVWSQELLPIHGEEGGDPGLVGRLGKHGKVVTITGSNNDKETKKAIEAFQNDPNVAAIVVSNAANFGVNLQAGHSIIKCGFPPVPSKDEQLDARIFRRGQDKDVESITYLAKHPLMEQAYANVHEVKGRSMSLLSDLADDNLLGETHALYGSADKAKVAKGLALLLEMEELLCCS